MVDPAAPPSRRTIAGRVVGGIWAVNFLLLISDTLTYKYQSQLSIALAITAMVLLFDR